MIFTPEQSAAALNASVARQEAGNFEVYTHLFDMGSHEVTWDIHGIKHTMARRAALHPERMVDLPPAAVAMFYGMRTEWDDGDHLYAMGVDLANPIIIIDHPSNGRRFAEPGFPPFLIIDGWHRIIRAFGEGKGLRGFILTEEEERLHRRQDVIMV